MKFKRKAEAYLQNWKISDRRKPLLLRGARQIGKTTLVETFSQNYKHKILLNLEKTPHAQFFKNKLDAVDIWKQIALVHKIPVDSNDCLLFIDEIQEVPEAIKLLRYFYEELPQIHVIAAGSLLEFALKDMGSFPVGRIVEYTLHPLDFEEFLLAINEDQALALLQTIPCPEYAHNTLQKLFSIYTLIGGMPEVVKTYIQTNADFMALTEIYSSIWDAFKSDFIKYAATQNQARVLRYVMEAAPNERERITFGNFGGSGFGSRDVGEAFRLLDLAKIIYLVYPVTQVKPPHVANITRKPKLQFLDTGLLNYANNLHFETTSLDLLNETYRGFIFNHVVNQEQIAQHHEVFYRPHFWVREKTNSNAEVDLVIKFKNLLIPIEVKAGKKGSIKSLNEFIIATDHSVGVRILDNTFSVETLKTKTSKEYTLVNIPLYASGKIEEYLAYVLS